MSEIKLKPCPFCGGEAYMDKFYESCDGRGDKAPKVKCKECGSSISMSYEELWKLDNKFGYIGGYRSNNKELLDGMHQFVAEQWNTRNTEQEIRNKAIDEFVEKLKESLLHSYRHLITTDTDGFEWLTTDSVETHIDEVIKQMKEV